MGMNYRGAGKCQSDGTQSSKRRFTPEEERLIDQFPALKWSEDGCIRLPRPSKSAFSLSGLNTVPCLAPIKPFPKGIAAKNPLLSTVLPSITAPPVDIPYNFRQSSLKPDGLITPHSTPTFDSFKDGCQREPAISPHPIIHDTGFGLGPAKMLSHYAPFMTLHTPREASGHLALMKLGADNQSYKEQNMNYPAAQSALEAQVSRQSSSDHNIEVIKESESQQDNKKERRRRSNFTKRTKEVLIHWFEENVDNPYPNEEDKQKLREITSLSISQINNWFVNARRRNLWVHERAKRAVARLAAAADAVDEKFLTRQSLPSDNEDSHYTRIPLTMYHRNEFTHKADNHAELCAKTHDLHEHLPQANFLPQRLPNRDERILENSHVYFVSQQGQN